MTYNANAPNTNQSPGLFPNQGSVNFSRLKTLFNAEHIFNDTAGSDDGLHRQMSIFNRTDPVSLPDSSNFMFYSNNNRGKMFDGTNLMFIPRLVAAVTFNGSAVISSSINVSSVSKTAVGDFTVNFSPSLPDTSGQFCGMCFKNSIGAATVCTINTYTIALIRVNITNVILRTNVDPDLCSIMIYKGF